ncbi:MAG: HDOD domain-containing protein [Phycisphaerae bacterium]
MGTATAQTTVPVFATTQPIFDRLTNVYGYDMDFRSGFEAEFAAAADRGGGGIDFWRVLGFDVVLGLGRAHVTFPRDLLLQSVPVLFPPDTVVVGVPGDLRGDRELIDACRQLKDVGYELELLDFAPDQMDSPFLDFGDIVRLRMAAVPHDEQAALCEEITKRGVRPLASGVATPAQYHEAYEAGFWYFQGEFFRRPVLASDKELPSQKAHYLSLLKEVNKPELAYDELENIIKLDVAMTYRLLRFINSAWYGLKQTVSSIRHALVLLGPSEVRVWASMLLLRELGEDAPKELFRRCLIRAKMAEGIAPLVAMDRQAQELFLMGMFSLAEALTNVPLARVLEGLPLSQDVKMALLAQGGPFGPVYETVEQYDQGQWQRLSETAAALDLDENALPALFGSAIQWADKAVNSL